ncbi:hypothetical protein L1987_54095 [Smallanthus sonchifolius]|uniref:Uncharacterized protein n=1 Tax=Smallanthus sonchifolius TaxID=185202 RepID=A0ACB9E5R4_9ASTR|nr:hypothetical protein L1987_54095 [Smallanthus sonchifolius]
MSRRARRGEHRGASSINSLSHHPFLSFPTSRERNRRERKLTDRPEISAKCCSIAREKNLRFRSSIQIGSDVVGRLFRTTQISLSG